MTQTASPAGTAAPTSAEAVIIGAGQFLQYTTTSPIMHQRLKVPD